MRPESYPPCKDDPDACAKVRNGEEHDGHWWGWRTGGPIRCKGYVKQAEPQVA